MTGGAWPCGLYLFTLPLPHFLHQHDFPYLSAFYTAMALHNSSSPGWAIPHNAGDGFRPATSVWFLLLLILLLTLPMSLSAQANLHVGMSADEFRSVRPGILPEEETFSGTIGLADTIEGIAGTWNLTVGRNRLVSAQFHWNEVDMDEEAYNLWRDRIVAVCNLAQKAWGAPLEFKEGKMSFHPSDDRRPEGLAHGSREGFQDMVWEMGPNRIAINSGFVSNHYPLEMHDNLANSPHEYFSYGFSIIYEEVPRTAPVDRVEMSAPIPEPEEEHTAPEPSAFSPANVRLGMSLSELRAAFPRIQASESSLTGSFSEDGECNGLPGGWRYQFEKGRLTRLAFSHYGSEINANAFQKCLDATKAMIATQTMALGAPVKSEQGNTKFEDPYKKRHWGYKVLRATWDKPQGTATEVRFEFFGGKGEYSFIVNLAQELQ